eukprot:TRINITY_DN2486_c0_g2_i1.p1 TRINITY_DN2486_c0_g2~~TRINITY_DN2486_c0_g2_i1.p1  ORF type:complete len:695 (+),score=153.50 TRINITY_DN2486_c0_g2_i1:68-2086(+)
MTAVFGGAAVKHHEVMSHRSGVYDWEGNMEKSDDESDVEGDVRRAPKGSKKAVTWGKVEDTEGEIGDALGATIIDDHEGENHAIVQGSLRERVYILFTDPASSRAAMAVSFWFFFLIIASTITFMLETLPSLSADPEYGNANREDMWFYIETVFVAFFTCEYMVVLVTSPNPLKHVIEPFSIVDLLAIVPYYVELALKSSVNLRFIRVVRLARVFRVLKMGKKYDGAEILLDVVKMSIPALLPPFFFLFLGIIFFSSLIFLCEQGTYDPSDGRFYVDDVHGHRTESVFVSIPESLWWCTVTMTTVGYGDYTPRTAFGKIVNSAAMIFGVIFSAMPIAVIGSTFTVKWDEMKLRMNATKDFHNNEQINNTSNWGPNQLKFFGISFDDHAVQTIEDLIDPTVSPESAEAMAALEPYEAPDKFISRKLSHELLTNRDLIEKSNMLPKNQRNLAYKLYHIMRAESSKCENNIETYTLDFAAELHHVLGFAKWDEKSGVHLGFRSKAGLTVTFGEGRHEKEIRSDSDMGVFALKPDKKQSVYFVANEAGTTAASENYGRIAGELLAIAQNCHKFTKSDDPKTVFLVTYRGYHMRFYAAEFSSSYLEAIRRGKKPEEKVTIRHFPPKRSMHFTKSTIMGTFDFLTPSHREEVVELLLRIKRLIILYCIAKPRVRRSSM